MLEIRSTLRFHHMQRVFISLRDIRMSEDVSRTLKKAQQTLILKLKLLDIWCTASYALNSMSLTHNLFGSNAGLHDHHNHNAGNQVDVPCTSPAYTSLDRLKCCS